MLVAATSKLEGNTLTKVVIYCKDLAKLGNIVAEILILTMWRNWKAYASEAKFASGRKSVFVFIQ